MPVASKYPANLIFFTELFEPIKNDGAIVYPPLLINHGGQNFNVPEARGWCGGEIERAFTTSFNVSAGALPNKNGAVVVTAKHLRLLQLKAPNTNSGNVSVQSALLQSGTLALAAGESLHLDCGNTAPPTLSGNFLQVSASGSQKLSYMLHGDD